MLCDFGAFTCVLKLHVFWGFPKDLGAWSNSEPMTVKSAFLYKEIISILIFEVYGACKNVKSGILSSNWWENAYRYQCSVLTTDISKILVNFVCICLIYFSLMQIKCRNVITLAATNVDELNTEWDCLLDTQESGLVQAKPFVSKHLSTTLSDVCLPDIIDLPISL